MKIFCTCLLLVVITTLASSKVTEIAHYYNYGDNIYDYRIVNGYSLVNNRFAFQKENNKPFEIDYSGVCSSDVKVSPKNEFWCLHERSLRKITINSDFKPKVQESHETIDIYSELYTQQDLVTIVRTSGLEVGRLRVFNTTSKRFEHERTMNLLVKYAVDAKFLAVSVGRHGAFVSIQHLDNYLTETETQFFLPWDSDKSIEIDEGGCWDVSFTYHVEKYDLFFGCQPSNAYDDNADKKIQFDKPYDIAGRVSDEVFISGNDQPDNFSLYQLKYENEEAKMVKYGPEIPISIKFPAVAVTYPEQDLAIVVTYSPFELNVSTNEIIGVHQQFVPPIKFSNGSIIYCYLNGYIVQDPNGTIYSNQPYNAIDQTLVYFQDSVHEEIWYGTIYGLNSQNTGEIYEFNPNSSTIEHVQLHGESKYFYFEKLKNDEGYNYRYYGCDGGAGHFIEYNGSNKTVDVVYYTDCYGQNFFYFAYNKTTGQIVALTNTGPPLTNISVAFINANTSILNDSVETGMIRTLKVVKDRYFIGVKKGSIGVQVFDIAEKRIIQEIDTPGKSDKDFEYMVLGADETKYPNIVGAVAYYNADSKQVEVIESNGDMFVAPRETLGGDYPEQYTWVELKQIGQNLFRATYGGLPLILIKHYKYERDSEKEALFLERISI